MQKGENMKNPWEEISLSDYENHMQLDSVKQLQSLNMTMKKQFEDYDVSSVMILGIAGGNGLEHINKEKFKTVYGVDINENYLQAVSERYQNLGIILKCLNIDIANEADRLPETELLIANLLIEYIGYEAFAAAVKKAGPKYVSCVIQINQSKKQWVSDSPYIHAFDGLDRVHCQMEENKLMEVMNKTGYKLIKKEADVLPNGKSLVRLDFKQK